MTRSVLAAAALLSLAACTPTPHQLAHLIAACEVDGRVVPVAQGIVADMGTAGATAAAIDKLLVHPAVVAACEELKGKLVVTVTETPT